MKTTPNQQLAIDIRDCNVLVSAAAGSGKTSVLVERIISRITDKEPIDIDRLLIMTFTNAAAAEMRSRIREAIDSRIETLRNTPDTDPEVIANLEKQSLLVHRAMITTIHGFCKSVLTDHFEEIGIDPNFRVADENECKLMQNDALDICMENSYEKGDESFLHAVECFSKSKDDKGLVELVIPVYNFIMSDPEPEGSLKNSRINYEYDSYDEFLASPFMERLNRHVTERFLMIRKYVSEAETILDEYESLAPYRANIDAYKCAVTATERELETSDAPAFDIIRHGLAGIDAPRFGSIRDDKLDESEQEAKRTVTLFREAAKASITSLKNDFPFELDRAYSHIVIAGEELRALSDLVLEFKRVYDALKRDNNVIDFNDMEHMAVTILKNSDIAEIYRQHFAEIYVDEYQDTNMAQEMLVSLICRHDPGNVFQVGDVKQSIYRFRKARPDIFLGKFNTYTDEPGENRRILLNDNFRSRRQVIDSVNEIFSKIMKAQLGGIEYDKTAALSYGAAFYDEKSAGDDDTYKTELLVAVRKSLQPDELTANVVADRINSMMKSGFMVYDKGEEKMRPVRYGDFTILVRSIKKFEPVFRKVFGAAGIPFAASGREGYFATLEVRTCLAFLSAVDNSLCDIELATVMRSPVGGFDDKDMARLAGIAKDKCLYERVKIAADTRFTKEETIPVSGEREGSDSEESCETEKLKNKCENLLALLHRYKVMSTNTPVHILLSHFIDNEYVDYVKCMTNAPQRMANLRMLLSKAEDYGKTSFKGLYRFIRYMDQIRKYDIDDGEAGIVGENDDVVRLMTMHASKGLEFPVCFLAGLERKRNTRDEIGRIIWGTKEGFGLEFTDINRRITGTTLPKVLVREENKRDAIAEEMRILYVAMTRAREKLIMVAVDKEDAFDTLEKRAEKNSSLLDMIKDACIPDGLRNTTISFVKEESLVSSRLEKVIEDEAARDGLYEVVNKYNERKTDRELLADADESDKIDNNTEEVPDYLTRLTFTYPYHLNPDLRPKLSVSDLKHKAIEEKRAAGELLVPDGELLFPETEPERYIPKFMRQEGQTKTGATFYGTAFHRIMELWDYSEQYKDQSTGNSITIETINEFAQKMHKLHRMDRDQVEAINAGDVKQFLDSALARRMGAANAKKLLFREQPFVIGIEQEGETVLVQGIIDAYFIEDDGITIVDYKTDRVSSDQMLIDRYRTQLEYYGMALHQIMGKPIKALMIYSTCLKREIIVNRA